MQTTRALRVLNKCFMRIGVSDALIPKFHKVPVRHVKSQRKHNEKLLANELYIRRLEQGPEPERPRSAWINWNYSAELYSFGQRFGENFNDDTLKQVFTHKSYIEAEEAKRADVFGVDGVVKLQSNEAFVTKGDKVLVDFIKASLRHHYPVLPEESVRCVCDYLTSEEMLAYIGNNLGIKDLVLTEEFPPSTETICKTFKAVIGGLLHDQGLDRSYKFIQDFVLTQLIGKEINELLGISNPMGMLEEILEVQRRGAPEPRLMYQSGSTTIVAVYKIGIYSDKQLIGQSYGETVTIAEEMASRDALSNIFGTTIHRPPINYKQPIVLQDKDFIMNRSLAEKVSNLIS